MVAFNSWLLMTLHGLPSVSVDRICGVWLSLCVCVRLASRVSRASRVCVHLSRVRLASACICLACVSRLSASVHVKGSECVRRSSCLASRICLASVSRLASRVCVRLSRVCVRLSSCLASVSRRSSCLACVCLSL